MGRITCDAEDWLNQNNQLGNNTYCNTCLTSGQAIGLAFSTQAGAISFVSVLILFAYIAIEYYKSSSVRRSKLFASHVDVYMFNMFVAELLMAFGGILDAKWANEAQVYCGGFCNVQGSLQFIGETSASIWTLAVTLHTCVSVVYARRLRFRPWLCCGLVLGVWAYVLGFNFGSFGSVNPIDDNDKVNYFAPTPFWCWVGSEYNKSRYGEYVWLWLAGVGNIVVYVPLYSLLRGNMTTNNGRWPFVTFHQTPVAIHSDRAVPNSDSASTLSLEVSEERLREEASKLLWYPAAYTMLVLPLSVSRWISFGNDDLLHPELPGQAPLATAQLLFHALYRLSGVVNVGLVVITRPNILLLDKEERERGDEEEELQRYPSIGRGSEGPRQRANASQPPHREAAAGFGGPAVNLDRDDDKL